MATDTTGWHMRESGELEVVLPPDESPGKPDKRGKRSKRRGCKPQSGGGAAAMAVRALMLAPVLHAAELAHVRTLTRLAMMANVNETLAALLAALK